MFSHRFIHKKRNMKSQKNQILLSICIPSYNGHPYITKLIHELLISPRDDFEIVVSDDCSNDDTWQYVEGISQKDSRLKCYQNKHNLGMDRNFTQTVALAKGQYVWLCGQDDFILHEGIDVVLNCIKQNQQIDFLRLNHVKVDESEGDYNIAVRVSNQHVFGQGLKEFLIHHDYELPTFLPIFIIRKSAWDKVDVSQYYGTCYCQVGVFLESSEMMHWCHVDGDYVVGLTPTKGWQVDPDLFSKISFGLYAMLNKSMEKCGWIEKSIMSRLVEKNYKRIIFSSILVKSTYVSIENRHMAQTDLVIKKSLMVNIIYKTIFLMPQSFSLSLMKLINIRRIFRKLLLGKKAQGPHIHKI